MMHISILIPDTCDYDAHICMMHLSMMLDPETCIYDAYVIDPDLCGHDAHMYDAFIHDA